MGVFGYSELVLSKACLLSVADATNIITVGNVLIAAVTYANGAAIDALTPDDWTDVVDINLGVPFQYQFYNGQGAYPFIINMDAETVGDYVRAQLEIDGVVVADFTVGPSKYQAIVMPMYPNYGAGMSNMVMFAKSRLRIRLFKHGTIDNASSYIKIPLINYQEVTP